jgi:hypothetical protein
MKRFAAALLLSLTLHVSCATVVPYLPTVLSYVTTAINALNSIDAFVDAAVPDGDAKKKIDMAIARTQSALAGAQAAIRGAEHLTQAQVDAAFDEFQRAYVELLILVKPYGVRTAEPGERLSAMPGGLTVPSAIELVPRV